ncbi:helix-turn-helix domain-containing protein, partial [Salmonella sp. NW615]|uniref:helix-turn-helix domain-containing protein n=1 Tax=Salmonella sp. NW615 TaxID=2948140 RepID=UPI003F440033
GSCAAPSAKGDDKFITTDYLQQCPLIRERQREGIALAKQRGAYRGRKKSLSSERIAELRQRVEAGEQKTKLAREFGISRETLYQYLRTDQ